MMSRSSNRITMEVISNAVVYISEEMGIILRNTAYSPNIKDRLDHTCAILDPEGDLVAQAEHIPVHIGSMAIGVKNTLKYLEKVGDTLDGGDVVIVNDPYISGTHLNDITLLKPVYMKGRFIAIVANKAHHVDVGGAVPGSIGGDVRELIEEGIIIPPVKLYRKGRENREVRRLLEENVRTPSYFKGDLSAQIASLNVGEKRIIELADKYGIEKLEDAWDYILDYSEKYLITRIEELEISGRHSATDYLEHPGTGTLKIRASVAIKKKKINVDFSGTDDQVNYPINAVYGVTVAATSYSLKSVIDPDMPMNHGFLRRVSIKAPIGSIVNPIPPAPVSGGNVETSQRIADVIFKVLSKFLPERVPAASCGSMNNIMVGGINEDGSQWAFYETVGGGSGGRPGLDGVDGVHTNMTNTLNTPIEVLEREYPILFIEYSLRVDSGGPGKYRGGLGITRAFMLVSDEATLTIMTERNITKPWGLNGGEPGQPGNHFIMKEDGNKIMLPSKTTVILKKGDRVYINTPGGGGYGDPYERNLEMINKDLEEGKITTVYAKKHYFI